MRAELSWTMPWGALCALVCAVSVQAQDNTGPLAPGTARVVELSGTVQVMRKGATVWDDLISTNKILNPGDQLRTGQRSRAALLLTDLTVLRLGDGSRLQIPELKKPAGF